MRCEAGSPKILVSGLTKRHVGSGNEIVRIVFLLGYICILCQEPMTLCKY